MTTLAHVRAIQDPSQRRHFVYWAYDAAGVLLYIGCTMRPTGRLKQHRADQRVWLEYVARWRAQGPYSYETARRMEREAIDSQNPPYNNDTKFWTNYRRSRHDLVDGLIAARVAAGQSLTEAISHAVAEAERMLPTPVRYVPAVAS